MVWHLNLASGISSLLRVGRLHAKTSLLPSLLFHHDPFPSTIASSPLVCFVSPARNSAFLRSFATCCSAQENEFGWPLGFLILGLSTLTLTEITLSPLLPKVEEGDGDGRAGARTMRKNHHRCCVLGTAVLLFCLVLYLPLLLSIRPPVSLGWNMNRDLRVYVRPDNQTTLITAEGTCPTERDLLLVVVVCSAIPNMEARRAIRDTWGSYARNHSQVRLVFLLGRADNDTLHEDVQHESDTYGDIIQEDFLDTYNNLTLKTVMLLKWVDTFCRRAKYVMKTDDDMFVNLPHLMTFLTQKGKPQMLVGNLICGAVPIKDRKSKWYSPNFMFAERVYPNYLSGTGYVLSRDVVSKLYEAALDTPFFHMEDVYITGILTRKLKLRPQDNVGFSYQRRPMEPCLFKLIVTSHRMTPSDLYKIWKELNNPTLVCDPKKKIKLRDYGPLRC